MRALSIAATQFPPHAHPASPRRKPKPSCIAPTFGWEGGCTQSTWVIALLFKWIQPRAVPQHIQSPAPPGWGGAQLSACATPPCTCEGTATPQRPTVSTQSAPRRSFALSCPLRGRRGRDLCGRRGRCAPTPQRIRGTRGHGGPNTHCASTTAALSLTPKQRLQQRRDGANPNPPSAAVDLLGCRTC